MEIFRMIACLQMGAQRDLNSKARPGVPAPAARTTVAW
jgi:hypothetical protein